MGATNCPETPRQRMIGMMYLVLTAMLALNVSKDMLDAFVTVDETLVRSNANIESTISYDYQLLKNQEMILGKDKVANAMNKANQLQKQSNDMIQYIEKMKETLLNTVDKSSKTKDGKPKSARDIEGKDNYSKASNFFMVEGNAKKLKDELLKYRNSVLNLIEDPMQRENFSKNIGIDVEGKYYNNNGQEESWETHNFDHTILIACVTLLNKTMGEIKNAESMVLKNIISGISANDFKFDNVSGRAIPKSQMVFEGEDYEADIIVAAFDSKQSPEVYYRMGADTLTDISSATRLEGESGMVKLKLHASSTGDQKYAGIIKIKKPDGSDGFYAFKDKYSVVKKAGTVAAEKMNVLYAGIANPLSASAPVDPKKIRLSVPGCTVKQTDAGWDVDVPASLIGKQVEASISADMGGNRVVPLGTTKFRVKKVPNPEPYINGNIQGGRHSKTELLTGGFLLAKMGEDFVYDLQWKVKSCRATITVRGLDEIVVCTNLFSEDLKSKIQKSPPGTVITFSEIRATSTAGERVLRDVTVRIK
ncbi:MAG: gliding motility protein GldM [Bacteroidales bacterium]|jgi:gliding motility-associated protein GldM|nr:gliding motility protein GldM [Bacteroidales bacterium]